MSIINFTVLKRYKRFFCIFLILSFLSLVDITTRQIVLSSEWQVEGGFVSLVIQGILVLISPFLALILSAFVKFIFDLAILWIMILVLGYVYFRVKEDKKLLN